MKSLKLASFATITLFAATSSLAHASIVANGNFSSGLTSWTTTGTGTTPGTGVGVITIGGSNSTGYGDNVSVSPNGSTNAVYFVDDNANETLAQNVTLAANTTYALTFDLYATSSGAGNPFNFLLTDSLGNPSVIAASSFGNAAQAGSSTVPVGIWTPESLIFTTGAAGSYALDFNYTSGASPAKDVLLTDVALNASPVPEPSSLMLLGTGLAGLAGAVRRRIAR